MKLMRLLAKVLSVSRDVNAARRGPDAYMRRQERKALYRIAGRAINKATR